MDLLLSYVQLLKLHEAAGHYTTSNERTIFSGSCWYVYLVFNAVLCSRWFQISYYKTHAERFTWWHF